MSKFEVYLTDAERDIVIVRAQGYTINGKYLSFYVQGEENIAVFNFDNIMGFKEVWK